MASNKNEYLYTREKLGAAMYLLTTGPGDIRSRLGNAFVEFHTLNEDNFPNELKREWRWVREQLTKFGPVYSEYNNEIVRGSVEHTMSKIKNSTGVKIAKKICSLRYEIENYIEKNGKE